MNLEGIIAITGKTGLFKIISQGKSAVIVESLVDKKRMPITARHHANTLEEIGIYTYEGTKPLSDIFDAIATKEDAKQCISHKGSKEELIAYFSDILPEFDEERVYISDIKKVIQWYNTMQTSGLIELPKVEKKKSNKKEVSEKE
ncbi:MAG: DUF5606 domain-containing protein [Bacteroidota bacterium]|nr:DUF5606 domain-containing protein [Bacteroidota bacterium]